VALHELFRASDLQVFLESRNSPKSAPLSLYLGGGPGTNSLGGATAENGPCTINADSNSTTLNPHSWNNHVNMLYIDQPVQVGFSYDTLIPSTADLLTGGILPTNGSVETNGTFISGTLPSQNPTALANTTRNAAKILWKFTQIWLQDFPEHESTNDRVSVWANSVSTIIDCQRDEQWLTQPHQYGGFTAPAVVSHFESQNHKICNQTGTLDGLKATRIHIDTLGITNGCIDAKIEGRFYPEMAFNNTYGLQAITEDLYQESLNNLTKPGGCNDLIDACRSLDTFDPQQIGTNETINGACALAATFCFANVQGAYVATSGVGNLPNMRIISSEC